MIRKAVIAVPPVRDFYFTPGRAAALGPLTLRKVLSDYGVNAVLLNFPLTAGKPRNLEMPDYLDYLKPFMPRETGPVSFFAGNKRFGPGFAECAAAIAAENPSHVFISCFAWAYAEDTLLLAAEIKAVAPEVFIAAGGPGASVFPAFFKESPVIDEVLPGEAEDSVPAFLSCRPDGRGFSRFIWSQTGISRRKGIRFVTTSITRGCPRRCRFCSNHLTQGRVFRRLHPSVIYDGIKQIPDDKQLVLNFEDDNLLWDKDYFYEVIAIIKTRFPGARFTAANGLDYSLISPPEMERLIHMGFISFDFSMASADPDILSAQARQTCISGLEDLLRISARSGLRTTTYFIAGLPGDSPEKTLANLAYIHRLPTLSGISLFYPVPGLPGFEDTELFRSRNPRLCAGSSAYPWTGTLTTEQMVTAFRLSRLSNLIKTAAGVIPGKTDRTAQMLLDTIMAEKSLFTISRGEIVPAAGADAEMTSLFLEKISAID